MSAEMTGMFGMKRGQCDVVVSEGQAAMRREKRGGRQVELGVDRVEVLLDCHVG